MCRVAHAFIVELPNLARGRVLVMTCRIHAGRAAVRTISKGMSGVVLAFTTSSPSGAVVVEILALGLANAAGHGAVHVHIIRVLLALTLFHPVVAVVVYVGALRSADAA